MKFLPFFILTLIICISCNNDPTDQLGDDSSFFKCQIDGEAYEIDGFYAYAVVDQNGFTVYGTEDIINQTDARLVYIVVAEDMGEATYNLDHDQEGVAYYTNQAGDFSFYTIPNGSSGQLNITEKSSDRIKGTFNFTAIDPNTLESVSVSNGQFDLEIRE